MYGCEPLVPEMFSGLADDGLRALLVMVVQEEYGEALQLYERSLSIREKVLGPNHPDVANSLNNLADLLRKQVRVDAAHRHGIFTLFHRDICLPISWSLGTPPLIVRPTSELK